MKNKSKLTLFITGGSLLVILLVVIITGYLLLSKLEDNRKDWFIGNARQGYALQKLEFCHNNTIVPCDDEHITDWNKAHSDTPFVLKSFNQVIEQGIEEYNLSRQ